MNTSTKTFASLKPLLRLYFVILEANRYRDGLLGEERPLIRDLSSHQGLWNASVSDLNHVRLVFIRSSYGLLLDPAFSVNWKSAGTFRMMRSSYHALYPQHDKMRQLDNWYRQQPTLEVVPRVLDMEVSGNMTANFIADLVWSCIEIIHARDGKDPIIYSRANLINTWLASWTTEMLNRLYWWLAQYLFSGAEHPGPCTLPYRLQRSRVLIHQTSDHKTDFPDEAESLSIDWNRWELGSLLDMFNWIRQNWGTLPPRQDWYNDIDAWARTKGFASKFLPPGG